MLEIAPLTTIVCNKYHFLKGGAERYYFNIRRLLEDSGHRAIPFSVRFDRSESSEWESWFVEPQARAGVHFREFELGLGAKMRGALDAAYSLRARRALRKLVREVRPDVGYLLNIVNYLSPSIVDAFRAEGVPVVMRLSDYNFACASHTFFREGAVCMDCKTARWAGVRHRCVHGSLAASLARVVSMRIHEWLRVYHRVDHFFAPSREMARQLVDFGIDERRVEFLPTFVEASAVRPTFESGGPFLFVGRVTPEKGVRSLLEAWKLVRAAGARMRIVGEVDDDYLERELRALLPQDGLEFVGARYGEDLRREYESCSAVVVPSVWHDNSPNVVLEAMAHGKPVIGARMGGIPDQIGEDAGWLFEAGNAESLASALDAAWAHPALSEIGRAARARAEREFSPARHLELLLARFEALRNERHSSA